MDWIQIGLLWAGGVMTGAGLGWAGGWVVGRALLRRELSPEAPM